MKKAGQQLDLKSPAVINFQEKWTRNSLESLRLHQTGYWSLWVVNIICLIAQNQKKKKLQLREEKKKEPTARFLH